MRLSKYLLATLALFLGLSVPACAQDAKLTPTQVQNAMEKKQMLTIITRSDPETQLMALILTKAASDAGKSPRILLCDQAGDLALKQPPANLQKPLAPKNISPSGLLRKLVDSGIQVDVCAIYLPNRDFEKEALLKSIGVAAPSGVADYFIQNGTTVLSF